LHGRLWTAERQKRHGLQQSAACVLCDQADEFANHLLASCVFVREIWHWLLARVGFLHLCPDANSSLVDWWLQARAQAPNPFRRGFDTLVLLVSWEVWKERNRRMFENLSRTPAEVLALIRNEGDSWIAAGFRSLAPLFAFGA
jgi:hypothetical protein